MLTSTSDLSVLLIQDQVLGIRSGHIEAANRLLQPRDRVTTGGREAVVGCEDHDLVILLGVCGSTPAAEPLAASRVPCMAIEPYLGFHPYHAAFYRQLEAGGGMALPASAPEQIAASIRAVRARKTLSRRRLLLVDNHEDDYRAFEVRTFADGCREHLGVEIVRRSVDDLVELAGSFSDADADRELGRWYNEILDGPGDAGEAHMRQAAKLYLAERRMIEESGCAGITVDDIGGFFLAPEQKIMPNVSYGPLVFDGYLAAEEGDIEVLATELLLQVGLGAHPTMSNIYLGFRDRFNALESVCTVDDESKYTHQMRLDDYRQCVDDNHITAAHFSTSGVLPPDMMQESRYAVRETLPHWPGQMMVAATPKLGPVVLGRLSPDGSGVHLVPGEVDGLGFGDQYGWYRGRWFIRIPSVTGFISECRHQHYAIGPENDSLLTLRILADRLLGLSVIGEQ